MNPATIIKQSSVDGVILSLSASNNIKATGDQDQVSKWLPAIREHKDSIILLLESAGTSFAWLINFLDRNPLTVTFSPAASHAEVIRCYPDASAIAPLESYGIEPDFTKEQQ
jgi:hypothetical protein